MLSDEQKAVLHYAIDNGFDKIEGMYNTTHWIDGKTVKIDRWINGDEIPYQLLFRGVAILRIKQIPDSIDWTHVSTDIYCMARDAADDVTFFTIKPEIYGDYWCIDDRFGERYYSFMRELFASYKRGTTCWKESLVLNPYYKEKK